MILAYLLLILSFVCSLLANKTKGKECLIWTILMVACVATSMYRVWDHWEHELVEINNNMDVDK